MYHYFVYETIRIRQIRKQGRSQQVESKGEPRCLPGRCAFGTAIFVTRPPSWGFGGDAVNLQIPDSEGVLEVRLSVYSLVPAVSCSDEVSDMKHSVMVNLACRNCSSILACSYALANSSYVEEALSVDTMLLRARSKHPKEKSNFTVELYAVFWINEQYKYNRNESVFQH